jgi:hypothetical protein
MRARAARPLLLLLAGYLLQWKPALAPGGYFVARLLDFTIPHEVLVLAPFGLPVALIVYYLVWKYFVGFLNAELGIA